MTPDDLRAWQAHMGYTQQQAADELGMNRVSFARLVNGAVPIDRRTGLSCAALAAGLREWCQAQ